MYDRDAVHKANQKKMNDLIKRLKSRGFEVYTRVGFGGDYQKPDSPHDSLTVFTGKSIVAKIKMKTTSSWRAVFSSWQVHLPTYEPRGHYNRAANIKDPSEPMYWGWSLIKSSVTVVEKVVLAIDAVPSNDEIAIGELRQKIDDLSYDQARTRSSRQHALGGSELLTEVHAILTRDDVAKDVCTERLQKAVKKLGAALKDEQRISDEITALWSQIAELEKEDNE